MSEQKVKFKSSLRTRFFSMTPENRHRLLSKLKAKLIESPNNEYYKMCVAGNDVFCIKCKNIIDLLEELVGKHGLGRTSSWNYYHRDCFQRLYL
jgi:hypothetical protein